jgi:hypothetical protein
MERMAATGKVASTLNISIDSGTNISFKQLLKSIATESTVFPHLRNPKAQ